MQFTTCIVQLQCTLYSVQHWVRLKLTFVAQLCLVTGAVSTVCSQCVQCVLSTMHLTYYLCKIKFAQYSMQYVHIQYGRLPVVVCLKLTFGAQLYLVTNAVSTMCSLRCVQLAYNLCKLNCVNIQCNMVEY